MTMSHVIEQAVLDIEFGSEDQAFAQQPALSAFMTSRLTSVMDNVLAGFSSTDMVVKIDCLVVDLGIITSANLLDEMTERFREGFRSALQEQLQVLKTGASNGGSCISRDRSAYEQIEYFLRTGHMPWQASLGQDRTVEEMFRSALRSSSEPFAHFLKRSARRRTIIKRLVSQFRETVLADLLRALVPSHASALLSCMEAMRSMMRQHPFLYGAEEELDKLMWECLLDEVVSRQGAEGVPHGWAEGIVTQLARRDGVDAALFLAQLRDQAAQLEQQSGRTGLSSVLQGLLKRTENESRGSTDPRVEDQALSENERPGVDPGLQSQAVIHASDLYERLRMRLLQGGEPAPGMGAMGDLTILLAALRQVAPWQLQRFIRELQAGAFPWPPIAARLSTAELRQVLKTILICLHPANEAERVDLLRAIDRSAGQADQGHSFYCQVIESLLRNPALHLEAMLPTIRVKTEVGCPPITDVRCPLFADAIVRSSCSDRGIGSHLLSGRG